MNIILSVVVALEMFLPNFMYEFLYFSSLSFYSQLKMYTRARNLSKIGKKIQSGGQKPRNRIIKLLFSYKSCNELSAIMFMFPRGMLQTTFYLCHRNLLILFRIPPGDDLLCLAHCAVTCIPNIISYFPDNLTNNNILEHQI